MMKDTAPLSVVIVDDNIVNLMVIEHYLNRLFVNHVSFTDPHKALTYLQTNACDIVITDYSMPGMDGFELIKAIKKFLHVKRISFSLQPISQIKRLYLRDCI